VDRQTARRILAGIALAAVVTAIRYAFFFLQFRTFMLHVLLIVLVAHYGGTVAARAATGTSILGIVFLTPLFDSGHIVSTDALAIALFGISGIFLAVFGGHHAGLLKRLSEALEEQKKVAEELKRERVLRGILPTCGFCHRVRDEQKRWLPIEDFISMRSEAEITTTVCRECFAKHYPGFENANVED
jgi:hypothetical protein